MKALRFIVKYMHYFLVAKNEHAIQGPFIFEFVTNVIYGKTENDSWTYEHPCKYGGNICGYG